MYIQKSESESVSVLECECVRVCMKATQGSLLPSEEVKGKLRHYVNDIIGFQEAMLIKYSSTLIMVKLRLKPELWQEGVSGL